MGTSKHYRIAFFSKHKRRTLYTIQIIRSLAQTRDGMLFLHRNNMAPFLRWQLANGPVARRSGVLALLATFLLSAARLEER